MSKVWLITGSSRGVGRKLVEAALETGDHVVATARKPERLHELVDHYGDRIRTVQHDIRDASVATMAVRLAVDVFEHIDVVVNAARSADHTVEDFSDDSFRDAVLPILRQQRSGHIIEISPSGSFIASLGLSGYRISKEAVEDFTLELAHEVAPLGIKITIVETGSTHNSRVEPSAPVVSQRCNESGIDPEERAHAHDNQEGNDPRSVSRLILSIAEMAEPPVRLVVGADATQHLSHTGQALAGLEAKWRN